MTYKIAKNNFLTSDPPVALNRSQMAPNVDGEGRSRHYSVYLKAHSMCGAAASHKRSKGASLQEIMSGGRWLSESSYSLNKKAYLQEV